MYDGMRIATYDQHAGPSVKLRNAEKNSLMLQIERIAEHYTVHQLFTYVPK